MSLYKKVFRAVRHGKNMSLWCKICYFGVNVCVKKNVELKKRDENGRFIEAP